MFRKIWSSSPLWSLTPVSSSPYILGIFLRETWSIKLLMFLIKLSSSGMLKSSRLKTGLADEDVRRSPTRIWYLWYSSWSLHTYGSWRQGRLFGCGNVYLIVDVCCDNRNKKMIILKIKEVKLNIEFIFIDWNISTKSVIKLKKINRF